MERHMTIRRGFPIVFLVFALAMAVPVAALVLRGVTSVMTMFGIVMEFDAVTAVFFSVLLLPRIFGSLWAYFKVENMWGNEVAYMAFFLWFPIIAGIFYAVTVQKLKRPPRGYEWATIKEGIVHQPIYEYVGPPQPTPAQAFPQVEPTQDQPPGPPPAYSSEYPPQRTPYLQQRPGHPQQVPPYQG
ncbi:MAG: hypothetical protein LN414_06620, partial [Candidatus Thermoplasmatota archaeon]|nr:hypothetical protein [Candidatus Thermoplasmatota archaeon]